MSPEQLPWLPSQDDWKSIEADFPQHIDMKSDMDSIHIHQSLLTAVIARSKTPASSAIKTWAWTEQELRDLTLRQSLELSPLDEVTIVLLDTGVPDKAAIQGRYSSVDDFNAVAGGPVPINVHPCRNEADADGHKVADIRALDAVASDAGWWRPVTCFGLPMEDCVLTGKDVKKRSWSGCSKHVTTDAGKAKLLCGGNRSLTAAKGAAHWFHQEYVPLLASVEFRVFVATQPNTTGIRNRTGYVVRVCVTNQGDDGRLSAKEAMDDMYAAHGLTKVSVEGFALAAFERLRGRTGDCFSSLEVGARLDVAVNKHGGDLFINEVTRWYGAHYMSTFCLGLPCAHLCAAFADAWIQ